MKPHLFLIIPLVLLTGSCVTRGPGRLVTSQDMKDTPGVNEALTSDGKYIRNLDGNPGNVVQFEVANGRIIRITNRGLRGEKMIKPMETGRRFHPMGEKSFMTLKPIR